MDIPSIEEERERRAPIATHQTGLLVLEHSLAAAILALLSACATAPPSLPAVPPLATDLGLLTQVAHPPALPDLAPHPLDLADGLDETEAAMLAVANNPDLRALRAASGVSDATLFAAGLLPDPQLNLGDEYLDKTAIRPSTGERLIDGFSISLGYDLSSLITRGARRDAARATNTQTRLDLVWSEWQVAQQARILHRKLLGLARRAELLAAYQALFADRSRRSAQALSAGDITLELASGDLVGVLDAETRARDQALLRIDTEQAFRALLGLRPLAPMPVLIAQPEPPSPDAETVAATLATVAQRRPDLRALAAGYEAQDAKVRAALLNRLPNLSISFGRARDTGGILTTTFGIGVALPFLDGNRGVVRIERATAEQLRAEYGVRLAQTYSDAWKLVQTRDTLAAQLAALQVRLPVLQDLTAKAEAGVDHHDLDPLVYLSLRTALITTQLDVEDRIQAMTEDEAALSTLLGLPPESWMPHEEQGRTP